MVSDPMDNYNACDDFFVLVVHCHILSAAMQILGMNSMDDYPSEQVLPSAEQLWMRSDDHRKKVLQQISWNIANTLPLHFNDFSQKVTGDKVHQYANQLLSLGCFYLEYSDAIREEDGLRVLRCWRYILPMFLSSGKRNYAIEGLNFLLQHGHILPPQQAAELIWSRFINVHGIPGRNIPNDLHMEHLNCVIKTSIQGLCSNKTLNVITRLGNALGVIAPILSKFDVENCVTEPSGTHHRPHSDRDMKIVIQELSSVFKSVPSRHHETFRNPRDPLHAKTHHDIHSWIVAHIRI